MTKPLLYIYLSTFAIVELFAACVLLLDGQIILGSSFMFGSGASVGAIVAVACELYK
jgi:hypothetical protein